MRLRPYVLFFFFCVKQGGFHAAKNVGLGHPHARTNIRALQVSCGGWAAGVLGTALLLEKEEHRLGVAGLRDVSRDLARVVGPGVDEDDAVHGGRSARGGRGGCASR